MIDNNFIVNLRKKTGLSQTEFAKTLEVGQPLIAMVEAGKRNVSQSLIDSVKQHYPLEYQTVVANNCDNNVIPIPFYHIGAAAGSGSYIGNTDIDSEVLYFDKRWLGNVLGVNTSSLHLVYANGDSMDSKMNLDTDIKDKDLLLVDTNQLEGNNRIFVILVNKQELRVKRLFKKLDGTLIISSNNPMYKEEVYKPDESDIEIEVIGRVVWNGSKFNI